MKIHKAQIIPLIIGTELKGTKKYFLNQIIKIIEKTINQMS
jgi:hypothetical protein